MAITEKYIINELLSLLQSKIDAYLKVEKFTYSGPTLKRSINNITIAYNIYPILEELDQCFKQLEELLSQTFKFYAIKGELIVYNLTDGGKILDMGKESFLILKAKHFEFYIYEPGSVIYCRLLTEYDTLKEKRWISVDFDVVIESAWFTEGDLPT